MNLISSAVFLQSQNDFGSPEIDMKVLIWIWVIAFWLFALMFIISIIRNFFRKDEPLNFDNTLFWHPVLSIYNAAFLLGSFIIAAVTLVFQVVTNIG